MMETDGLFLLSATETDSGKAQAHEGQYRWLRYIYRHIGRHRGTILYITIVCICHVRRTRRHYRQQAR